jgi:hypothetical protein
METTLLTTLLDQCSLVIANYITQTTWKPYRHFIEGTTLLKLHGNLTDIFYSKLHHQTIMATTWKQHGNLTDQTLQ